MKTGTVIPYILLIFSSFLPVLSLILYCFGYTVSLFNYLIFSIIFALVFIASSLLISKHKITCKFAAMLPLISLINMALYVFKSKSFAVFVFWAISFVYSVIIAEALCKSAKRKTATVIISTLLAVPVLIISFAIITFNRFGVNTVVEKIYSPKETYFAEIVDSDQGALGGDTIVYIRKNKKLNLFFLTVSKKPQRVYIGEWKEYETMQIYWKSEHCLIINSEEYYTE